jgi:hypothetical protein
LFTLAVSKYSGIASIIVVSNPLFGFGNSLFSVIVNSVGVTGGTVVSPGVTNVVNKSSFTGVSPGFSPSFPYCADADNGTNL